MLCYQAIDFMLQCSNGANKLDSPTISESNMPNDQKSRVVYSVTAQMESSAPGSSLY